MCLAISCGISKSNNIGSINFFPITFSATLVALLTVLFLVITLVVCSGGILNGLLIRSGLSVISLIGSLEISLMECASRADDKKAPTHPPRKIVAFSSKTPVCHHL